MLRTVLRDKNIFKDVGKELKDAKDAFYIGRGIDYAMCEEGSLKLKEVSYTHSDAYEAGELKHGTISLIEEGTLVAAVATQDKLFQKALICLKNKHFFAFFNSIFNITMYMVD